MSKYSFMAVVLGLFLTVPAFGQHEHAGDAEIGQWEGQISVAFDGDEPFSLAETSGILTGWAGDEPGFNTPDMDEPDEQLIALTMDTVLVLEVVSMDPALKAHTPGFVDVLTTAGDSWTIGSPVFDDHPTWHIDSTDPAFDPMQTQWVGVFRFLDAGTTGLLPSEPFTIIFTNLPAEEEFIRGDANADGAVDVADAVSILNGLFGTGDLGECEDAVDANDDGSIDVADGVTILNTLFGGGAPLPAPSGVCGDDLTDDGLFCAEHDACLLE